MAKQTILIVEDEKDIRELLAYHLAREGFAVLEAENGLAGLDLARSKLPDLILLDLMLPGMDGLTVCRQLQRDAATADLPLVMVTARGEEVDRIVGLELGAADYIVKPFSLREVVLRIQAVLRRRAAPAEAGALHCGPVMLDPSEHSVRVSGTLIDLTVTEFRLLQDLVMHQGKVRTREQLLAAVWGHTFEGYSRTVDTHVRRLRAKLGDGACVIETIRGIGYRAQEPAL